MVTDKLTKQQIRLRMGLWGAVIAFTPFLVYVNSFSNNFLAGDDEEIILRNRYLTDWRCIPQFFTENYKAGAGSISNFWRPFQLLTYSLIIQTAGFNLFCFHLSSLLFHSLSGLFLYLIFLNLFRPFEEVSLAKDKRRSARIENLERSPQEFKFYRKAYANSPLNIIALAVLAWTVHPLHNEELLVVSGLASPSHLFWMLAGMFSFLLFIQKEKWYWFFCAGVSFILSLCSKESAVVFPGLLLGLHITAIKIGRCQKTSWKQVCFQQIPFWIIALAYVVFRLTLLNFDNTLNFYSHSNVFTQSISCRLYTLATVLVHGLRIIFLPYGLHPERSWPVFTTFFTPQVVTSFLLLGVLIIAALKSWKKKPLFTLGIFWFFASYLPMSNFIARINAIVWDHWFYAPSAGIFLSLAALFLCPYPNKLHYLQKIAVYILVFLTTIFAIVTFSRNNYPKDTESVSRFILNYEPQSAKTWNNLAMALADKGNHSEAIESYLKAIALSDVYPNTHHNLANTYIALAEYELAEQEFLKAIALDKDFYYSYLSLGRLYLFQGDSEKAAFYLKEALKIYPSLEEAKRLLSQIAP